MKSLSPWERVPSECEAGEGWHGGWVSLDVQ